MKALVELRQSPFSTDELRRFMALFDDALMRKRCLEAAGQPTGDILAELRQLKRSR